MINFKFCSWQFINSLGVEDRDEIGSFHSGLVNIHEIFPSRISHSHTSHVRVGLYQSCDANVAFERVFTSPSRRKTDKKGEKERQRIERRKTRKNRKTENAYVFQRFKLDYGGQGSEMDFSDLCAHIWLHSGMFYLLGISLRRLPRFCLMLHRKRWNDGWTPQVTRQTLPLPAFLS